MLRWTVEEGRRDFVVEDYIMRKLPGVERKEALYLVKTGARVNGLSVKKGFNLEPGDIFELYSDGKYKLPTVALYEDDNIIIFEKQPGVHGITHNNDVDHMYAIAEEYMRKKGMFDIGSLTLPYVCHDMETLFGGLMIVAKEETILKQVADALKERRIRRFFRVITGGVPKASGEELHHYLTIKKNGVEISGRPKLGAAPVLTRYWPAGEFDGLYAIDVETVTDQPHQLRAHLAYAGFPVLGDEQYGSAKLNKKYSVFEPAVWADRIDFEVGQNNALEYLDKKSIFAKGMLLPLLPKVKEI